MINDRYIRFLMSYYEQHKTINNISRTTIVTFEGETLKIGEFLASIRKQHKLYLAGSTARSSMTQTALERYKILDNLEFEWEPGLKKQKELEENDVCLHFIQAYYSKNQTLEGLPNEFTVGEKTYSVKNFLTHIRVNHKKYINGEQAKGCSSKTAIKRYKILDSLHFDWEPLETKRQAYEAEDKYIAFLAEHYKKHQTLSNVPRKVIYNQEELNIESFLSERRKKHRKSQINPKYIPSSLELKRWEALEQMNIDWEPLETEHQLRMENDKYIRFLQHYYNKHKTINDIKTTQEVIFEGEILKIGVFISDMRKRYLAYLSARKKMPAVSTPLVLKRYQELNDMHFDWRPSDSKSTLVKIAQIHGIETGTFRKYVAKFDGDIEKAIKICKGITYHQRDLQKKKQAKSPTLNTIAQEFEIDIPTLTALLNKPSLHTTRPRTILMYDKNTNLRQYCLDNGLNYTVIQKAVKLRMRGLCEEDLQSLINRCICEYQQNGQQRPSTWIYSKYGNEILVTHLLTYLSLDAEAILHDMSSNCVDLFTAIEKNSFVRSSKKQYDYLEFIYLSIIKSHKKLSKSESNKELVYETVTELLAKASQDYHLSETETTILESSYERYSNAIEQYKLFNVGFEKDPDARVAKIIEYNLDDDEIEEAFFMPLKFDSKALIGRDSELYKRRIIMKNLTVRWDYMDSQEHQEKIVEHNLTEEEVGYITKTRQEINAVKQLIRKTQ